MMTSSVYSFPLSMASSSSVHLVIKNPSSATDFPTSLPLDRRVLDLKKHISEAYPGHPDVDKQKLIFFGRLLQDDAPLSETFVNADPSISHTVHLVISRGAPTPRAQVAPQNNPHIAQNPMDIHRRRVQLMQEQMARNNPQPPQNQPIPAQGVPPQPQQNGADLGLLVKLAILVFILAQGGSTFRAVLLLTGAFLLYLYLTGRFRIHLHHYRPPPPPQRRDVNGRFEDIDAELQGAGPADLVPVEVDRGIRGEISDIIIPFLASLAPTWDPYALDAPRPVPAVPAVPAEAAQAPVQ